MEFDFSQAVATVEAVLFLETEPVSLQKISDAAQFAPDVVRECLGELEVRLRAADCGLDLLQVGEGYMLCPKKHIWETLKLRYGKKNDERLSSAALETLGIVANNQPVTRAEVESLRGVSADNMIRQLLEKDFIKEAGKKDIPGHPTMYGTTQKFLDFFHLKSIADLPKLEESDEQRFTLAR